MLFELYKKKISSLKDTKKYRQLQDIKNNISLNAKLLDFSSNDYLLLSKNQLLLKAAIEAGEQYGVGATGSRLLSGNSEIFSLLEQAIATGKNAPGALFFSSGYLANFTTLACLLDVQVLQSKPIVFFDKLNHASLYQAIFLAKPELVRYEHNDMNRLSELLNQYAHLNRPKFIITETVFGMDGDTVHLPEIVKLAQQHNALLYLDEAHATGLYGKDGYGLSTTVNIENIPYIIMGTFSKALGCSGGYVASENIIKNYLINKNSGFIYSTATSPLVAGAALKAWNLIPTFKTQREELLLKAKNLREKLKRLGFNIGKTVSHIIPIILNSEDMALKAKEFLLQHNIITSVVRPPTVPPNTSRIRIALNIGHSDEDLNILLENLKKL